MTTCVPDLFVCLFLFCFVFKLAVLFLFSLSHLFFFYSLYIFCSTRPLTKFHAFFGAGQIQRKMLQAGQQSPSKVVDILVQAAQCTCISDHDLG